MTLDWLYRLSDWNPQFFREVKGRLKSRNLGITVTASLLLQVLVLFLFWGQLPGPDSLSSQYCTGKMDYYRVFVCINRDSFGTPAINWTLWWADVFRVFSWALPFVLLIAGVYMLIGDLSKEEKRGTLNFIRLSPQLSDRILIGKILGVPIIPYLVVALAVPLHLWTAIAGGISLKTVLAIYLLTAAACGFYYAGALLFAFLGGFQGWVGAIVVWVTFSIFFQVMNYGGDRSIVVPSIYFNTPIGSSLMLSLLFGLITFGVGTYWVWQAVNRRFRNPNATLLSKRQSYLATASFEVWLLGFVVRGASDYPRPFEELAVVSFVNLLWFMVMIAALIPQRQMLLDWARYRRERVSSSKRFWSRSIMTDLLWGEKSPALVAMALNLGIAIAIFTPWILAWSERSLQVRAIASLGLGATFILICATIAQMILFMKSPRRTMFTAIAIGGLVAFPPVILGMLSLYPHAAPIAWLFSAFAIAAVESASLPMIFVSFLGHLSILSLLNIRIARQLKKAGESESKALLSASRA